MNDVKGYFRIKSDNNFVVMSSGGYRMTYSVSGTGTNNVSAVRDRNYFGFDGTNFAAGGDSYKFCIYRLSE